MGNNSAKLKNPLIPDDKIYQSSYSGHKVIPQPDFTNKSKCINIHKTREWLGKPIAQILLQTSKPEYKQNINYINEVNWNDNIELKQNILTQSLKYNLDINNWYRPSQKYWDIHCGIFHTTGDKIKCDVEQHVKTFSQNELIKNDSIWYLDNTDIIEGIIFTDDTFRILTAEDFQNECQWFQNNIHSSTDPEDIIMMIQNINMNDPENETYIGAIRYVVTNYIRESTNFDESNSRELEAEFYQKNKYNTVCDYLKNVLKIFIFINPQTSNSIPYEKQDQIKTMILTNQLQIHNIPYLDIDVQDSKLYEKLEYLSRDIMNIANSVVNSKQIKFVNTPQIQPQIETQIQPQMSQIEQPESNPTEDELVVGKCDLNSDDNIYYVDKSSKIYCFTVGQLLNRKNNVNPYTNEDIDSEFLNKFENNLGRLRNTESCSYCNNKINETKYPLGYINESGHPVINIYCSVGCVENKDKEFKLISEDIKKCKYVEDKLSKFNEKYIKLYNQYKLELNVITELNKKIKYYSNIESIYKTKIDGLSQRTKDQRELSELIDKLNGDKLLLNLKITELKDKLTKYESQIRDFPQQLNKYKSKIGEYNTQITEVLNQVKKQYNEYSVKLKNKDAEIEKLKNSKGLSDEDKTKYLKRLELEKQNYNLQLDKYKNYITKQNNKIKELYDSLVALKQNKSNIVRDIQIRDISKIKLLEDKLKTQHNLSIRKIAELTEQLNKYKSRVASIQGNDNINKKITLYKEYIKTQLLNDKINNKKITELQNEIYLLKLKLPNINTSDSELLKCKTDIETCKSTLNSKLQKISELETNITFITREKQDMKNKLDELQSKLNECSKSNRNSNSMPALERDPSQVYSQTFIANELKTKINELTKLRELQTQERSQNTNEINKLKSEINLLNTEMHQCQENKSNTHKIEAIKNMDNEINKRQELLSKAKSEMEKLQSTKTEILNDNKIDDSEKDKFIYIEQHNKELNDAVSKLEEEKNKITSEKIKLESDYVQSVKSQQTELEKQIEKERELNMEIGNLKNKINELKSIEDNYNKLQRKTSTDVMSLSGETNKIKSEKQDLEKEYDEMKNQCLLLERESSVNNEKRSQEIEELKSNILSMNTTNVELKNINTELLNKIKELEYKNIKDIHNDTTSESGSDHESLLHIPFETRSTNLSNNSSTNSPIHEYSDTDSMPYLENETSPDNSPVLSAVKTKTSESKIKSLIDKFEKNGLIQELRTGDTAIDRYSDDENKYNIKYPQEDDIKIKPNEVDINDIIPEFNESNTDDINFQTPLSKSEPEIVIDKIKPEPLDNKNSTNLLSQTNQVDDKNSSINDKFSNILNSFANSLSSLTSKM